MSGPARPHPAEHRFQCDRARAPLSPVCREETLAGRGNRIKAYTVAVEVFGRDSTFDPQNDPIVRIAASHLRRSLERYYLTAGKSDPMIIEIPKGGYVPSFSERASPDAGAAETPTMLPPAPGQIDASPASAVYPSDDIRAQLERILSSEEFHGGARGATLLSYIVEETLAGRAERIKGHSIAIEVFKRSESFTQDDPVVRIEAARLAGRSSATTWSRDNTMRCG